MKLEEQVVSLELAKKLKELGVKQESLFYYFKGETFFKDKLHLVYRKEVFGMEYVEMYSAFTVAELLNMIMEQDGEFSIYIKKDEMADIFAKHLIHLIEEKIITPEK